MRACRRSRRSGRSASSSDSDEAAAPSPRRPLRKRKPSAEVDDEAAASTTRQVRSMPPVPLPPPEVATPTRDDDRGGGGSSDDGEAWEDVGEVAVSVRAFPDLPPDAAAAIWDRFVSNAKACIEHYNTEHQADFVVCKRALEPCGLLLLGEQDGSYYYHINFHAQDKKQQRQRRHSRSSQLFFGEIRVRVAPKEEDVTCCCPVSHSDAGGKRLETAADAMEYEFPAWGTAGMDRECCYGCSSAMKHPDGASYVAGHVADPRQYFVPNK